MQGMITEKTFYQYLKCPNWIYFDTHASETRPHELLMARLQDDGLIEEKERELLSDRQDLVEVTAEDPDEAFKQTLAFMREGRQTIYHGVLVDKHWVGHPDILEKVEGRSRLGDYYYVASDMKRSRFIRDDHKFQGCFYGELLERVQGVKPVQGYIVTPDKEVLSYLIEVFEAEYELTLTEIEKIIAGKHPAHFVTSGCKQSPWYKECRSESESCDDLSLLNRVWREEVRALEEAGVQTLSELALKSVPELEHLVPTVSSNRLETMRDQAIAIKDHRHMIRGTADLPEANVELFFDIESDPLRDFDYLFGVLKVTSAGEEYISFFASSPEQEGAMWAEFVHFIERHIDAPIYHYGWFEEEVVRRFSAKYGIGEIAREALERNMIDILNVIRPTVIFPLSFYSLKDIAGYIGFEWRAEDASGANSVLWFEEWLQKKSPKLLQKILEYNEDDVRATHKLQRWIREHAIL
ncbi:MAG TPA: TM0106 family RecB-like putative nuclease [Patescibacteria group bacterium]|nr:TM0106 family RecB-like putative nuclease [Patescibacteria group bacterium]